MVHLTVVAKNRRKRDIRGDRSERLSGPLRNFQFPIGGQTGIHQGLFIFIFTRDT